MTVRPRRGKPGKSRGGAWDGFSVKLFAIEPEPTAATVARYAGLEAVAFLLFLGTSSAASREYGVWYWRGTAKRQNLVHFFFSWFYFILAFFDISRLPTRERQPIHLRILLYGAGGLASRELTWRLTPGLASVCGVSVCMYAI